MDFIKPFLTLVLQLALTGKGLPAYWPFIKLMDNETVKQDLYQAISEFVKLESTADNETISTFYTTIKVFTDELPVYPHSQTQAQIEAYNLAHGQSEADLIYFSPTESTTSDSSQGRDVVLVRLQDRAMEIQRILQADPN